MIVPLFRIILKWILRKCGVRVRNWIRLNQDTDQWRALVNTVMNLRVPLKAGSFMAEQLLKAKLSLCFNEAPRHEGVLEEWRYSYTHSLALALDGGDWSASRPSRFTSRERAPGTHWIGGWVVPRAVLDAVVKRKIPNPPRESNPSDPIVQPVAQRYTDWAITALWTTVNFVKRTCSLELNSSG
jgi:hypothetical protein